MNWNTCPDSQSAWTSTQPSSPGRSFASLALQSPARRAAPCLSRNEPYAVEAVMIAIAWRSVLHSTDQRNHWRFCDCGRECSRRPAFLANRRRWRLAETAIHRTGVPRRKPSEQAARASDGNTPEAPESAWGDVASPGTPSGVGPHASADGSPQACFSGLRSRDFAAECPVRRGAVSPGASLVYSMSSSTAADSAPAAFFIR
jgi:hypothetical protein